MKKLDYQKFVLILALGVFISSCAYKQQHALFKTDIPLPAVPVTDSVSYNYKIKPGDQLQIRNLQNISYIAEVQTATASVTTQAPSYQVEEDGSVALPVIGRITVEHLTRLQAARKIENFYKANLLKDPIIDLKIINLKVTVLGEVRIQGNYLLLKDKTNLVDVIGEAGGLTEKANETNVQIIRGNKAHPQVILADLSNVGTLANSALYLQNDDIIYVSQNKRAIRTDSMQNVSSIFQSVLLFINTALIIYTISKK